MQNNDNITPNFTTSATAGSNVGTYSIMAVLSDPGGRLGNYAATLGNGMLSVTPAVLTVTPTSKVKQYAHVKNLDDRDFAGLGPGDQSLQALNEKGQFRIAPIWTMAERFLHVDDKKRSCRSGHSKSLR